MIASSRYHDAPRMIAGYDTWRTAGLCYYDSEAAEKAVNFFPECLKHLAGANQGDPFHLEQWQADIIRTIFGWMRDDGTRRYRKVMWYVPRKNGKTTIAAGIGMYCFYVDREARAECYCAAADGEQAGILFDMFSDQVHGNLEILSQSQVKKHYKQVEYQDNLGTHRKFKALNVGMSGGHGMNVHFVAYDEYHLWLHAKHVEMANSLHTATASRNQPLELILTTAGYEDESICFKELQDAKAVRDGESDQDDYLPIIYEADDKDDWKSPEVWARVNPNLGVSVSEHYIRRECQRAQEDVSYENVFKRLHLNMWQQQSVRWIRIEDWDKCPQSDPCDFATEGNEIIGGLDLSAVEDWTAWIMVQNWGTAGLRIMGHYWVPQRKADEYDRRGVSIREWIDDGWVTVCPGARIEHDQIRERIVKDCKRYRIKTIGVDRYCAEQLRQELETVYRKEIIEVTQSFGGMSAPAKELQRHVLGHTLDTCNDPVMRWMAGNAEVKTDDNANIKIVKGLNWKKVDGIVASVNGVHTLCVKKPRRPSSYRRKGSLMVR